MKLSTKGRYGLRALIDLALYGEEEAVSIQSISARQQISDSYLEQLVRKLKKAGLVTSVRGAQGGYRLAKPAGEISVGDVLRALEGSIEAVSCGVENNANCLGKDLCVARYVWEKVNKSIQETVDSIRISQLVEESRQMQEKAECDIEKCEK
ncbi:MAG TPA: Rrf2 family transcriptional regulator [Candidatus Blautia merdigallinarum]|uniref:Rrf2 family transcriptional regulator n=1 Tax=Candidatus Blautia merdigallinarum TaxID=2838495 RepID=A0A9D2SLS7_9FIRM|nr:Rrf2 family transcriptional regulator [Candidatus Blautia merdigallinarum]